MEIFEGRMIEKKIELRCEAENKKTKDVEILMSGIFKYIYSWSEMIMA